MAITKTVTKQTLTLNVEDGVNSQGLQKLKVIIMPAYVRKQNLRLSCRLLLLLALLSVMS